MPIQKETGKDAMDAFSGHIKGASDKTVDAAARAVALGRRLSDAGDAESAAEAFAIADAMAGVNRGISAACSDISDWAKRMAELIAVRTEKPRSADA